MPRREERGYWPYLSDEQRRQPGCAARDFCHVSLIRDTSEALPQTDESFAGALVVVLAPLRGAGQLLRPILENLIQPLRLWPSELSRFRNRNPPFSRNSPLHPSTLHNRPGTNSMDPVSELS